VQKALGDGIADAAVTASDQDCPGSCHSS
jgi:hypothetical protein